MKTEGIKYAGSKLRLLPHIIACVEGVRPTTVLDAFAGTTRVSQSLAEIGCVVSNDISEWSKVFNTCYLLNSEPKDYTSLIAYLNEVKPVDGWFTDRYKLTSEMAKSPFQIHNLRMLDGVRTEIDRLKLSGLDKAVALASLMLALDKVDSTIGHFSSYLRTWAARSYNKLELKIPMTLPSNDAQVHAVYKEDIFELLPKLEEVDLAYLDPPYGSNNEKMPSSRVRYAAYYHFWTTVCLNDKPELFGKVGRRKDSSDKVSYSPFEDFRKQDNTSFAASAMEKLLRNVKAKHVLLSYSSGGHITMEELLRSIKSAGDLVSVSEIDYKSNVMKNMSWTGEWIGKSAENKEYLFLIRK